MSNRKRQMAADREASRKTRMAPRHAAQGERREELRARRKAIWNRVREAIARSE